MKKSELVFVPGPGYSHLVSTVEFANRLINRDHRFSITILVMKSPFGPNADAYTKSIAASEPRIQLIDLPQVDPPSPELLKSPENYLCVFIESHKPHVKDIVTNLISSRSNSNSVQLAGLVIDFFCTTMIDVANELGLPSYLFMTSGAAFLGIMLYLPTRHNQLSTEFKDSDPELLIPSFVNPVPARVLPTPLLNKDGGYTSFVKLAQRFRDTKGIIVNTFTELDSYAISSFCDGQTPPVYAIGPVLNLKGQAHPGSNQAHHDNIMKWLDAQPLSSVVFLCFGSVGGFGAPQVREIAHGLEHSGHRFLWSMRQPPGPPPKVGTSDYYTKPEDMLPEGFLERTKECGMVCGWAPQVDVLAHKAIGAFVSHCGWNSILESLWFGVPIVTWPLFAEQQLNAFNMVRELGLAVEMRLDYSLFRDRGDLVMADEVERAVRCVMEGDNQVKKKVKEMGEKCRKAVIDGGSSFNLLGRLIEDMIGNN